MNKNTKDDPLLLNMIIESIQETKTAANALYDIVCKGYDGHQSLLTRISVLERENKDKEERIADIEKFNVQLKIEDKKTKIYIFWLLIAFIAVFVFSIATDSGNIDKVKWFIELVK